MLALSSPSPRPLDAPLAPAEEFHVVILQPFRVALSQRGAVNEIVVADELANECQDLPVFSIGSAVGLPFGFSRYFFIRQLRLDEWPL
jgi:hypothetical protein